jgi:formate dehydrogenase subunit gamma
MAATTPRPETWLERFDGLERAVHWLNAALFFTLMLSGATLYLSPLSELVGRRALVENIHVWCGVALPVPLLAAACGPWGRRLRADLRRWNRWSIDDRRWLRTVAADRARRRRALQSMATGKFNAGQKLNASWTAGAGLVMLGTGSIMKWYHPWPLRWRTGATFVHDWLSVAIVLVVAGHIAMALRDPQALRSMVRGTVARSWAERHAPRWVSGGDD